MRALIDSRFVDFACDQAHIHDWRDYAGRLLDKRKANTLRKQKSRGSHARQEQDNEGTQRASTGDSHATGTSRASDGSGGHGATVQYRTVPNSTVQNQDQEQAAAAAPATSETFALAFKRVYQRDLTPFQAEELGAYIDKDGLEEAVIVRAIERSAKKEGGLSLVLKMLDDYASAGAKTVTGAKAIDDQHEASRQRPRKSYGVPPSDPSKTKTGKPAMPVVNKEQPAKAMTEEERAEARRLARQLDAEDKPSRSD
nr:DnaD domain protein [Cohnella sp. GbtcB17]